MAAWNASSLMIFSTSFAFFAASLFLGCSLHTFRNCFFACLYLPIENNAVPLR